MSNANLKDVIDDLNGLSSVLKALVRLGHMKTCSSQETCPYAKDSTSASASMKVQKHYSPKLTLQYTELASNIPCFASHIIKSAADNFWVFDLDLWPWSYTRCKTALKPVNFYTDSQCTLTGWMRKSCICFSIFKTTWNSLSRLALFFYIVKWEQKWGR